MNLDFINPAQVMNVLRWPLFELQGNAVSLFHFIMFAIVLIVTLMASRIIRMLFRRKIASRLESGVGYAVERVLHYVVLVIGLFVGFESIGLDLSSMAMIFGFLSVGIGFGLQNIAANFISGLILLFERPIKVGDMVSVEDEIGKVKAIKLRYTEVTTFDNIDLIIPNTTFVDGNVINWSHGGEKIRLRIPVGVGYGSDAREVDKILVNVAKEHSEILEEPEPQVVFQEFGDSALDFELRCWLANAGQRAVVKSDLNHMIYEVLNENGIEIPFPQRDLHLRSSDVAFGAEEG